MPLKGFIGDWQSIEPIVSEFKKKNISFKPSYSSREILFSYELKTNDLNLKHDPRVRLLSATEFEKWNEANTEYMRELHLPDELTLEQKASSFKKGFAKACMFHMLRDCVERFKHRKNILFTGEEDTAAIKLYESMGYRRIGFFALVL